MKEKKTEDRRQKTEDRILSSFLHPRSSFICPLLSVLCLLTFTSGCQDSSRGKISLAEQVAKLNEEKAGLQKQIEQVKAENEILKNQLRLLTGVPEQVNVEFKVLAGLAEQIKFEEIYHISRVKIVRYTNLYDEDKDGKKEKLIVYLQPIDQDGDVVKAPGAVRVQLWDLSKEDGQAILGEWKVGPEQLKKLWYTTLFTHYKLTFDVSDKIDEFKEPLTVKVAFIDYLTATVFNEQEVIKPQIPE
ncbi:MAG: hypothetical protein MUP16_01010 [Sedimentisphaerales bacterium]|jgi:hypothetical protein|nr:hypothetical protein [Sedimentisphaerales bacterium]